MASLRGTFRKLLSQVQGEKRDLANLLKVKEERLAVLQSAPLPADEFVAGLLRLVERRKDTWNKNLRTSCLHLLNKPFHDFENSAFIPAVTAHYSRRDRAHPDVLVSLVMPQIEQAIRDEVPRWPEFQEAGPALAERRAEMATLEQEIDTIKAEIAEINRLSADTSARLG